jgi:hypothetical protein
MLVTAARRLAIFVVLSAAFGTVGFAQAPTSGLGWGADFTAAKEALPKTQEAANAMAWPDVWKTFKGVMRETGWGPSGVLPAKFAKYVAPGWTFDEHVPASFVLFTGLAYSDKSGVDPSARTQSGSDRFTKYVSTKVEAKFSPADVTGVAYFYRGKSTQDTSGAEVKDSFDELVIHAKPDAFSITEKIEEFDNVSSTGGTYTWQNGSTKSDTVPVKDLHLPVIGLSKDELKGVGYLLVRIMNANGANALTLTAGS